MSPFSEGNPCFSKNNAMNRKYEDDRIAFANRVLNHREELRDEEVAAWLAERENRQLLDELAEVKQALGEAHFAHLEEAEWQRLARAIRGRTLRRRALWTMGAAAAVACLLALGIWGWLQGDVSREEGQLAEAVAMEPGTRKAELILAGGESIALGQATVCIEAEGLAGITDDSVRGLDYSQVDVLDGTAERRYNTLRVPVGGFYKLVLPDGSTVWLNAASELHFPVPFAAEKREVYLTGEGFFQVARDTSRQFVVHVEGAQVAVLGTSFNVSAYGDEEEVVTTLAEGAVAFRPEGRVEVRLRPGEQSVMEAASGTTRVQAVDPSVYSAWVTGKFVFRAMDLEAIMRQLQRWYGCAVFYTSEEVKQQKFWGAVGRDMELRKVLDIIEETTNVRFDIKGTTVVVGKT